MTLVTLTPLEELRAQLNRTQTQRRQLAESEPTNPETAARALAEMAAEIIALEVELGEAEPPAPDALEVLRLARGPLALRIADGDETARAEVADLEARIAETEEKAELDLLAGVERQRMEQEAAQEAERAEVARLTGELEAARAERERYLRQYERELLQAASLLPAFLDADARAYDLAIRVRQPEPRWRERITELTVLHLYEAGLRDPLPFVRRAVANKVINEFSTAHGVAEPEVGQSVTVAQCSVCTHDDRAAIESDLAAGASLRELEERYSVSRSALSRHGKHV